MGSYLHRRWQRLLAAVCVEAPDLERLLAFRCCLAFGGENGKGRKRERERDRERALVSSSGRKPSEIYYYTCFSHPGFNDEHSSPFTQLRAHQGATKWARCGPRVEMATLVFIGDAARGWQWTSPLSYSSCPGAPYSLLSPLGLLVGCLDVWGPEPTWDKSTFMCSRY